MGTEILLGQCTKYGIASRALQEAQHEVQKNEAVVDCRHLLLPKAAFLSALRFAQKPEWLDAFANIP